MKKLGKAFGGLAIVGAMAAGGSAFTASQTVVDSMAGIGSQSITGANIENVHYDFDASMEAITEVTLVVHGNTLDQEVFLSLDGANPALCSGNATATHNGGTPGASTYECTVNVVTEDATELVVVVADDNLQTSTSVTP